MSGLQEEGADCYEALLCGLGGGTTCGGHALKFQKKWDISHPQLKGSLSRQLF
jgi:hypothetical protein